MNVASPKPQDPSMEEILASIRRIIADDQEPAETASVSTPGTSAAFSAGGQPGAVSEADDVLDLADLPRASVAPPTELDIDVPELSFSQVSPLGAPSAELGPQSPVASASNARPAERRGASGDETRSAGSARPVIDEPAWPGPGESETLISNQATASIGQAFSLLSHTILSRNARTLEDLVTEMLKPLLKVWLDDNLPPMVERLVRSEIERMARGGR